MSGSKTIASSDTRIEAIDLQSSAFGVPLQVGYGVFRAAGNLMWYGGFKATPHTSSQQSGGKGGGVKTQNTTYTYSASVMMGLCEGPITGVPRVWKGKQLYSGAATPSQIATAVETYAVPSTGAMTYSTTHAASFLNCITVTAPYSYTTNSEGGGDLVVAADQPLAAGIDFTFAAGVLTILNAALRGLTVTVTYQWASSTIVQSALAQLGLTFGVGVLGQAVWSPLTSIAPTQAIGYSGLAYVAGQDYSLGTSAQVDNHTFEIQGPQAYSISTTVPDANPASAALDLMTNARYGANFPASQLAGINDWRTYCLAANLVMSPLLDTQLQAGDFLSQMAQLTNTAPVWSNGRLKMIPYGDTSLTANGATFTPNTTPIFDLTDSDFAPSSGGDPIVVTRKAQADCYNDVKVEFLNRANLYNIEISEAKDSANIDAFGLRVMDTVTAHWICDAVVARNVAQLILQRALYVRNTYEFTLTWQKIFLEPMDLVTLTDVGLGFNKLPVRIISVEESESGDLSVVAEDFPIGVAQAALYSSQLGVGYQHDYNASPGSIVTPILFEAPGALTANGLEVWCAMSSANANWGGCRVWVSLDGTNYKQIGVNYGGSRYGSLTGAISGGLMPVTLVSGQLASGSAADAAALSTLCLVGQGASVEFLSYQAATLTGALAYNLGVATRGAYGSTSSAHSATENFVRIDDAIVRSGLIDPAYVGKVLHFKFTSFNIFGGAEEALSAVTDYTFTPTGRWMGGAAAFVQADLVLLNQANCTIVGNSVFKATGSNGVWDASVYSRDGATGGAFASFSPAQTAADFMLGLNTDPTLDASYSSIDYAWYCAAGASLQIYESGAYVGTFGTYSVADVLSVTYDGANVRYIQNGVVRRTIACLPNITFYLDSSFSILNARADRIQFGALSSNDWASIGNLPLDPTNMVHTPMFDSGSLGDWQSSGGVSVAAITGQSWAKAIAVTNRDTIEPNATAVKPGETLFVYADINAVSATVSVNFGFVEYDKTGAVTAFTVVAGVSTGSAWKRSGGAVVLGATTVTIKPWIQMSGTGAMGTGYVTNMFIGRSQPGADVSPQLASFVVMGACTIVGNSIVKNAFGATSTWGDAGVYSRDFYTGGAQVSFVCGSTCNLMVGLNTDPATDASYTSLDYAWYPDSSGNLSVYESNVGIAIGTWAANDVLSVQYDNQFVRYLKNGAVLRTVAAPAGLKLAMDSAFADIGGTAKNVLFGPLSAVATGVTLVNAANMAIIGDSAKKVSGSAAWDSSIYSKDAFTGGAQVSWVPSGGNHMIGLNSDPLTDVSYTSLDYALQVDGSNNLSYIENGVGTSFSLTVAAGDVLSVQYDNQFVRYLKNGTVLRTTAAGAGQKLYLDSSFYDVGAAVSNIQFAPLSAATSGVTLVNAAGVQIIGDSARKSGGAATTWDSSMYSSDGYTGGAFVSFVSPVVAVNVNRFMLGLNSDPLTDNSYSSIDYAWYIGNAGSSVDIYESGSSVSAGSGLFNGAAGDVYSITYDGQFVRYFQNGVVRRQVAASPALKLFLDSSFYDLGAAVSSIRFGPLTPAVATTNVVVTPGLIHVGNSVRTPNTVSSTFQIYSTNGFAGGAYATCRVPVGSDTGGSLQNPVFGLNTDPATSASIADIDYGIHWSANGNLYAYESGTAINLSVAWTAGDVLAVTYDGANVRYLQNGIVRRTVQVQIILPMFLDSSFQSYGNAVTYGADNIDYGPLSSVTNIGAGQIVNTAQGSALNDDPSMSDLTAWNLASGTWTKVTLTDGAVGPTCFQNTNVSQLQSKIIPLSPSKMYRASVWARSITAGGTMYLRLHQRNGAGTEVGYAIGVEGVTLTSGWVRYSGIITPAAGTVTGYATIDSNYNTTGVSQYQDLRIEEVTNTDLLASGAATNVAQDFNAFGGASMGHPSAYTTQRSFVVTPAVDCTIEFSGSITASGVDPDSTINLRFSVNGTVLFTCQTSSGRPTYTTANSFAASGGVALTFVLEGKDGSGVNHIVLYDCYMRVTQVKR